MTEEDKKKTATTLIDVALAGKHKEMTFIRNINERKLYRIFAKATKKLVKFYETRLKALVKQYGGTELIITENNEVLGNTEIVNTAHILVICIRFYTEEYKMAKDYLKEYRCYLHSGWNWLDSYLFFKERPDEDMDDFRKRKWTLF